MAEETLLPGGKVSVLLGLGSNLGGRREFIERAARLIDEIEGVELKSISSLIETEPVGGPPQGRYLNGAAELETALEPRDLLARLQEVEAELGRVRKVLNGPRNIDLDILLFGDLVVDAGDLVLPHPRMCERAFVLEPLNEIAPGRVHPIKRKSVEELLEELRSAAARVPTIGEEERPS
ncbi:MAG: 2-amino-4-hydroxy-6-hydroxymethyldihydropteridine diphosphokinase [Planctomycetota bacterium]|jgi:dihydroneopterin aldolase/2-amino-4-hydroxy-6-hydroxymethyldihydropteridine diphosphokinase|nr:2-amino-4-hydroxy-6-hydroxymethyldihydropteridine diphosphokinase [Planctomycetota bacterium]HBO52543.1 2-amino-4-hydroxy-6-hydroxymethyldihydropteridine diphosphokinase [Planctomycetota bacterium]